MPQSSARNTRSPKTPKHPTAPQFRTTHPNYVAPVAGSAPADQPLTRREARLLESIGALETQPTRRERRAAERATPKRRLVVPPKRHLVLAMSGGLVVAAMAAGASLTFGAAPSTETASADAETVAGGTALPAKSTPRVVLSAVSTTTGTVTGGTSVTLTGSHLDSIASVSFGGVPGAVAASGSTEVTITAPAAADQGTVDVAFYDAAGQQITFDVTTDEAASAASVATPVTEATTDDGATTQVAAGEITPLTDDATATSGDATATDATATDATATDAAAAAGAIAADATAADATASAAPAATAEPTATASPTATPTATASTGGPVVATKVLASALAFSYTPDPAVEAAKAAEAAAAAAAVLSASQVSAQLAYVEKHWSDYNSAEYGVISGNDCMNFTSQSLIERGWEMDSEWSYSKTGGYSTAWASSTAFANYLEAHPEKATALTNDQRDQVKPGDVVQFDWDDSGDRDHTGIVTRVETTSKGTQIYYSSHTSDNNDQSIDTTSATISFFSIH